jgi:hypothetical protein
VFPGPLETLYFPQDVQKVVPELAGRGEDLLSHHQGVVMGDPAAFVQTLNRNIVP